jgi:hypothetical protein
MAIDCELLSVCALGGAEGFGGTACSGSTSFSCLGSASDRVTTVGWDCGALHTVSPHQPHYVTRLLTVDGGLLISSDVVCSLVSNAVVYWFQMLLFVSCFLFSVSIL